MRVPVGGSRKQISKYLPRRRKGAKIGALRSATVGAGFKPAPTLDPSRPGGKKKRQLALRRGKRGGGEVDAEPAAPDGHGAILVEVDIRRQLVVLIAHISL